jgi:hypothetical protein
MVSQSASSHGAGRVTRDGGMEVLQGMGSETYCFSSVIMYFLTASIVRPVSMSEIDSEGHCDVGMR